MDLELKLQQKDLNPLVRQKLQAEIRNLDQNRANSAVAVKKLEQEIEQTQSLFPFTLRTAEAKARQLEGIANEAEAKGWIYKGERGKFIAAAEKALESGESVTNILKPGWFKGKSRLKTRTTTRTKDATETYDEYK